MSNTFKRVIQLVHSESVRISEHGYNELEADNIFSRDIVQGIAEAIVVEDYPEYPKGSCVLVLQRDRNGNPIHIVWGIPKGHSEPAVLVTAYRPNLEQWYDGFMRRRE